MKEGRGRKETGDAGGVVPRLSATRTFGGAATKTGASPAEQSAPCLSESGSLPHRYAPPPPQPSSSPSSLLHLLDHRRRSVVDLTETVPLRKAQLFVRSSSAEGYVLSTGLVLVFMESEMLKHRAASAEVSFFFPARTHARTYACTHAHARTHALEPQGNETEENVPEKRKAFREDLEEPTGAV